MSSSIASKKADAWSGKRPDFIDQLYSLGLRDFVDDKHEFYVCVGKGGHESRWYHHYIVIISTQLFFVRDNGEERKLALVFELSKTTDYWDDEMVTPNVREHSSGKIEYKITVQVTLRYVYAFSLFS